MAAIHVEMLQPQVDLYIVDIYSIEDLGTPLVFCRHDIWRSKEFQLVSLLSTYYFLYLDLNPDKHDITQT